MAAVVAEQSLRSPVGGERDAAVGTNDDGGAFAALDEGGVSTAIEKEDALFSARERLLESGVELVSNDVGIGG